MTSAPRDAEILALRNDLARGLAAVKVMLEERTARSERLEREIDAIQDALTAIRTKAAVLEERITAHKELNEVTGRFRLSDALKDTKENADAEKWKAAAPIAAAFITGAVALITSIINIILHTMG